MKSPSTHLVYVVEDDEAVRASTRALLEAVGHTVRDFADAEELLRAGTVKDADCLVLDHNLPGLTGLELLLTLRSNGVAVPTFLVSADGSLLDRAIKVENATILQKPFSADALLLFLETFDP